MTKRLELTHSLLFHFLPPHDSIATFLVESFSHREFGICIHPTWKGRQKDSFERENKPTKLSIIILQKYKKSKANVDWIKNWRRIQKIFPFEYIWRNLLRELKVSDEKSSEISAFWSRQIERYKKTFLSN